MDTGKGMRATLVDPGLVEAFRPKGSVAFHHGLTVHLAKANTTDRPRAVHTIIYIPDGSTRGYPHPTLRRRSRWHRCRQTHRLGRDSRRLATPCRRFVAGRLCALGYTATVAIGTDPDGPEVHDGCSNPAIEGTRTDSNKRSLDPSNKRGIDPSNKRGATSNDDTEGHMIEPSNKRGQEPSNKRGQEPLNKR